jgi:predicted DNA repair protein MutK
VTEETAATVMDDLGLTHGRADRKLEKLVMDAIAAHPKRRGELRAEYTRRILRIVREAR